MRIAAGKVVLGKGSRKMHDYHDRLLFKELAQHNDIREQVVQGIAKLLMDVRVFPSLSLNLYWPEGSTGKVPGGILPPVWLPSLISLSSTTTGNAVQYCIQSSCISVNITSFTDVQEKGSKYVPYVRSTDQAKPL